MIGIISEPCTVGWRPINCKRVVLIAIGETNDLDSITVANFFVNDLAVQRQVLMLCAINNSGGADTVSVIEIICRLSGGRDLHKLPTILPYQAAVALCAIVKTSSGFCLPVKHS